MHADFGAVSVQAAGRAEQAHLGPTLPRTLDPADLIAAVTALADRLAELTASHRVDGVRDATLRRIHQLTR